MTEFGPEEPADLLACVRTLMRDPSAPPTLAELRFAIRKRQQSDWERLQVFWHELAEWMQQNRRGWKRKLTRYRRLVADLARLHEAERLAWGIDAKSDIFDELTAQWKKDAMIAETFDALRAAIAKAQWEGVAKQEDAIRPTPPVESAEPPREEQAGPDPLAGAAIGDQGGLWALNSPIAEPAPDTRRSPPSPLDGSQTGPAAPTRRANGCPAGMARLTRENPMIPPPPAIFVRGRFGGGVPTFDPHAAIQEYKRKEALGLRRF